MLAANSAAALSTVKRHHALFEIGNCHSNLWRDLTTDEQACRAERVKTWRKSDVKKFR
jgi:hypothetical protein